MLNQCGRLNLSVETILQSDMIHNSIFGPKKGSFILSVALCLRITIENFYSHTDKFKLFVMITIQYCFNFAYTLLVAMFTLLKGVE